MLDIIIFVSGNYLNWIRTVISDTFEADSPFSIFVDSWYAYLSKINEEKKDQLMRQGVMLWSLLCEDLLLYFFIKRALRNAQPHFRVINGRPCVEKYNNSEVPLDYFSGKVMNNETIRFYEKGGKETDYQELAKHLDGSITKVRSSYPVSFDNGSNKKSLIASATPLNMLFVLSDRMYSDRVKPDPNVLQAFKTWTTSKNGIFGDDFKNKNLDIPKTTMQDIIDAQDDPRKKAQYKQAKEKVLKGKPIGNSLRMMVKAGEYDPSKTIPYMASDEPLSQLQNIRPRLIAMPDDVTKILLCTLNKSYIGIAKQLYPSFCHGLNVEQLQEKLTHFTSTIKDPVMISWDESSYDKHQDRELIKVIDDYFIKYFYDKVFDNTDIPVMYKKDLFKRATIRIKNIKVNYKLPFPLNKSPSYQMFSGKHEHGTTSGDVLVTTLGNTLRNLAKVAYIAHLSGIKYNPIMPDPTNEMFTANAGDDALLFLAGSRIESFMEKHKTIFSTKDTGEHGLGAFIKGSITVNKRVASFLSKVVVRTPKGIFLFRPFSRTVLKSCFYDGEVYHLKNMQRLSMNH